MLDALLPVLRSGHHIVLRSTVAPGTTEWVAINACLVPILARDEYAEQILALVAEQSDLTLEETVTEVRKRRIRTSRSAVARFFQRHDITFKKKACERKSESEPTWFGRAGAGCASKGCLTPRASCLSTKRPSPPIWCGLTVGARVASR